MSVVYEPRSFIHDGNYPSIDDQHDPNTDPGRYTDANDAMVNDLAPFTTQPPNFGDAEPTLDLGGPPSLPKEDSPITPVTPSTPQRIKAIPKPERKVEKNMDGKYVCNWPNCSEGTKEFARKCEWNKHMDKHDRPYKCPAEGCEKLLGFTYSGGLLRHEREVHGKHGGPKNPLHCHHPTCKRHTGKGFSRLENLNEHLRRVHLAQINTTNSPEAESESGNSSHAGQKRKRDNIVPENELREDNKRLRQKNEELEHQIKGQEYQILSLTQQNAQLQETLRLAPAAPML